MKPGKKVGGSESSRISNNSGGSLLLFLERISWGVMDIVAPPPRGGGGLVEKKVQPWTVVKEGGCKGCFSCRKQDLTIAVMTCRVHPSQGLFTPCCEVLGDMNEASSKD